MRYKIEDKTNIKNLALSKLLSHHDTKQRLTCYFGKKAVDHYQQRGMPYSVAYNGYVFSSDQRNEETNNHEEADTLMIRECVKTKIRSADIIDVFSPDTDVLVLLVGHSSKIELRLNMVLSPTNTIKYVAAILIENKCNALIGLHAVTGCDTTGKMFKKSKKT